MCFSEVLDKSPKVNLRLTYSDTILGAKSFTTMTKILEQRLDVALKIFCIINIREILNGYTTKENYPLTLEFCPVVRYV